MSEISKYTGNYGETFTVRAVPQSGYTFDKWSDGNTDNPRTFTIGTQDQSFIVKFKKNEVTGTFTFPGGTQYDAQHRGSISTGAQGGTLYCMYMNGGAQVNIGLTMSSAWGGTLLVYGQWVNCGILSTSDIFYWISQVGSGGYVNWKVVF